MVGWLLWLTLGGARADIVQTVAAPGDRKALFHLLEVDGLPKGMALLVSHNRNLSEYVTVITEDGRHSLAGWYPWPRKSLSSPRVMVVPTAELGDWTQQVQDAVTRFDVKEREWLRMPEAQRGPRPKLEIELPKQRVDCGVGLRIQRYGPSHWHDDYVEQVHVVEATATSCSLVRVQPDQPSKWLAMGWPKLAVTGLSILAGLALMLKALGRPRGK